MNLEDRRLPGEGIPQTLYALTYELERRVRRLFRGTNLHWGLRRILQRLWIEDGLSQKEISDRVGSSESSISNMLKHLISGGWVERQQDAYDYRIARVYLTSQGEALKDAVTQELKRADEILYAMLGTTDAKALDATLEQMRVHLSTQDWDSAERARLLKDTPSPPCEL